MQTARRAIIHIGSDKAGSSRIQSCLHANLQHLEARGIHVVRTGYRGAGIGHAGLATPTPNILKELRSELEQYPSKDILLSYEGFHFMSADDLLLLRDALSGYYFEIVYYIRSQAEIAQSGILQNIKQGAEGLPLIDKVRARYFLKSPRLYSGIVDRFSEVFGSDNIKVFIYDRELFPDGDIAKHFFQIVCENNVGLLFPKSLDNPSLNVVSALFVQNLKLGAIAPSVLRECADISILCSSKMSSDIFFLSRAEVSEIEAFHERDNEIVAKRFGLATPLFPERLNFREKEWDEFSPDFIKLSGAVFDIWRRVPTLFSEENPLTNDLYSRLVINKRDNQAFNGPNGLVMRLLNSTRMIFRLPTQSMTRFNPKGIALEFDLVEGSGEITMLLLATEKKSNAVRKAVNGAFMFEIDPHAAERLEIRIFADETSGRSIVRGLRLKFF